ncbi:hypothetical protein AB1Y20_002065 [Prymnesium parvum]|uniref:OTU domain-containing protein n=1 Tax=Prymnesium parvum TaxID=97485 RepID=A0AB34JA72_PRYPA
MLLLPSEPHYADFGMPTVHTPMDVAAFSTVATSTSDAASSFDVLSTVAEEVGSTLKRLPDEETWGQPPKRRVRAKPDGRCQIRAVLHAAGVPLPAGIGCILTDDSRSARSYIQQTRAAAAERVKAAMQEDETLQMIVTCDFPDDQYETFDDWVDAMGSDDTEVDNSSLWHGGGQWLLYGLGLLLQVTIEVTSLHPVPFDEGVGFTATGSQDIVAGGERRIYLAMLHDDVGAPDHFDVLTPIEPAEGMEDDNDATMRDAVLPDTMEVHCSPPEAEVDAPSGASSSISCGGAQRADHDSVGDVARAVVLECLDAACEECDDDCCWVRTRESEGLFIPDASLEAESSWRDWALGLVSCRPTSLTIA